jgi:hypothetical protein
MRTQTITFLIFLLSSLSLSAQKNTWTINLNVSMQGQRSSAIEQECRYAGYVSAWNRPSIKTTHTLSNVPLLELTGRYNITNHFSIALGIGHRSYITTIEPSIPPTIITASYDWLRNDYIQVPLTFQYDIPLKNTGFSIFAQLGLNLNFLITSYGDYYVSDDIPNEFEYYDYQNGKLYNAMYFSDFYSPERILLFHIGLGFSYRFNSGVGISLSGKYNIGTSYNELLSYRVRMEDPTNYNIGRIIAHNAYSKSDCWNASFGVSYTFKKKEKKKEIGL